ALVHQPGRVRVLEGLPLHHVAPVTRRVADRHQQWLVLLTGASQRRRSPWQPVDGVLRVLAQVGRALGGGAVGLPRPGLYPARGSPRRAPRPGAPRAPAGSRSAARPASAPARPTREPIRRTRAERDSTARGPPPPASWTG